MWRQLLSVYTRFLRIGAFTIGGGIVMLGVIESELRATGKFNDDEISDMIVLATAVPGPIATNLSFIAGKAMNGWPGAVAALLGTATAPFLSILFLSTIIINHLDNPWLVSFFLGAAAGVVAVVWNSLWKMIKSSVLVKDEGTNYSVAVSMTFDKYICKGRWSLPPIAAFIVTAWAIMSWDVHPFIALIIGAVISIGGSRLAQKDSERDTELAEEAAK